MGTEGPGVRTEPEVGEGGEGEKGEAVSKKACQGKFAFAADSW